MVERTALFAGEKRSGRMEVGTEPKGRAKGVRLSFVRQSQRGQVEFCHFFPDLWILKSNV